MSESEPNRELIVKLAAASGWTMPDERAAPLLAEYKGILGDSRVLLQFDLSKAVPADIYEAE